MKKMMNNKDDMNLKAEITHICDGLQSLSNSAVYCHAYIELCDKLDALKLHVPYLKLVIENNQCQYLFDDDDAYKLRKSKVTTELTEAFNSIALADLYYRNISTLFEIYAVLCDNYREIKDELDNLNKKIKEKNEGKK